MHDKRDVSNLTPTNLIYKVIWATIIKTIRKYTSIIYTYVVLFKKIKCIDATLKNYIRLNYELLYLQVTKL